MPNGSVGDDHAGVTASPFTEGARGTGHGPTMNAGVLPFACRSDVTPTPSAFRVSERKWRTLRPWLRRCAPDDLGGGVDNSSRAKPSLVNMACSGVWD